MTLQHMERHQQVPIKVIFYSKSTLYLRKIAKASEIERPLQGLSRCRQARSQGSKKCEMLPSSSARKMPGAIEAGVKVLDMCKSR
eukprot:s2417_g15.t1